MPSSHTALSRFLVASKAGDVGWFSAAFTTEDLPRVPVGRRETFDRAGVVEGGGGGGGGCGFGNKGRESGGGC